jgi:peptidyl-prolyl cis-trans isomerase D
MQVGERSKPVQTPFGFHIIELLEIRPEQRTPLAEVREELIRELQSGERADLFYEKSDMMANLAFEQPDSLQGVAEALGMEIRESGWIGRDGGEGIGAYDQVVEASYSDDVLLNGNNSTTVEIGEDHVVVLRILEHRPSQQQPFEEVRERVSDLVRQEKIRALLEEQGNTYLTELRAGSTSLEEIATAIGSSVAQHPLTSRDAPAPDRAIINQVFSLSPSAGDKTVFSGFHAPGWDYVILALHEVRDGSIDDLDEAQRQQALRGLNRFIGAGEVQRAQTELRNRASITIPEDEDQ